MKALVLGASGFIGRQVCQVLAASHEVAKASLSPRAGYTTIDLLDPEAVKKTLDKIRPQIIINCAGIVENSPKAEQNVDFTKNLLDSVTSLNLETHRIIISGSAAEYGAVASEQIAIAEDTPLNAKNAYGQSKVRETSLALDYRHYKGLPIVIARIFNPIGPGMHPRFIIPGILRQVESIKNNQQQHIEVSRLDSRRDYINVRDIATAVQALIENDPKEAVYNVGSGVSTSNQELIELIVKFSQLDNQPEILESEPKPEEPVAAKADIGRLVKEFGWSPKISIEETIKEIVYASR